MPKRLGAIERFAPTRGLITEANKGDFPQDAAIDLANVEILIDGTVMRRKGLQREEGGGPDSALGDLDFAARNNGTYTSFFWKDVGIDRSEDYVVLQYGNMLYIKEDTVPLSSATVKLEIDLSFLAIGGFDPATIKCQFAADNALLLITNKHANPIVVYLDKLNTTSNALLWFPISLRMRVTDNLAPPPTTRSTVGPLTARQEFDLRNSGWLFSTEVMQDREGTGVVTKDPVIDSLEKAFAGQRYPTPAVLYGACRSDTAADPSAVGAFDGWKPAKISFGSTIPPFGKFIVPVHGFGIGAVMNLVADEENGERITASNEILTVKTRPTSCALHNGHAFYGGKTYDGQNAVMISRLINSDITALSGQNAIEQCYQAADPSSEEINDLVATDGLVLRPAGIGEIIRMTEFGRGVVVFSDNKVGYITGNAQNSGFTATNFKLVPVDDEPLTSPQSVVIAEGILFYFTAKGIMVGQRDEFGSIQVQSITDETIKSVYDGFPLNGLMRAQGVYIESERRIYWTIPDVGNTDGSFSGDAVTVLVYSFDINGFWHYTISSDTGGEHPRLLFPLQARTKEIDTVQQTVALVNPNVGVTTVGGELLTSEVEVVVESQPTISFATVRGAVGDPYLVEYCRLSGDTFYDWAYLGGTGTIPSEGINYTSFIEFAYVYGEAKVGNLGATYLHSFFLPQRPTEVSVNQITYPF